MMGKPKARCAPGYNFGGANMEYKQLVFVATQWKEELDEKTGTLYLIATASDSTLDCELLVDPIPGTDPVQYRYRCREVACTRRCELKKEQVPTGIRYYCRCPDGASLHSATTTKASKEAKKKKKKARRSK